jgi:hypothetical protein
MTFSASTCLTDLSGANLTDPIKFYSDVNNFLFEFNSANLSQLTGSSCPFILTNIPDGTKVVKIVSENNYCANIDVEKLDCGVFDFQLITNNDVSKIIATALKSSNVEPTDYKINWYGPNNTTNLVFSSGKGNKYSYDFTHPINQPVEGGTYFPVVENVFIDNKSFSNTGGTGNILTDLQNCLEPEIIQPCSCGNRTASLGDKYNHSYTYVATSNTTPVPVTVSLTLSAGTKYIGWSFKGYNFPDRLTIYFEGSAYPIKIGLDDWLIGNQVPSNSLKPTDFPKSAKTISNIFINKVINLDKFTVNNNDKIVFNITPSSNQTDWDLKYTCLDNQSCISCYFDQNNYKIPKSSITVNYDIVTCNTDIKYEVLNNCQTDGNFFDYNVNFNLLFPWYIPKANSTIKFGNLFYSNKLICSYNNFGPQDNQSVTCGNALKFTFANNGSVNTYTFSGNPADINSYYIQLITSIQTYSGTTTTDNSQLDYYNYININIPQSNSISCEKLFINVWSIPVSSTITKSIDGKTLTITPTVLTYNPNVLNTLPASSCSNCAKTLQDIVNLLNLYSTSTNWEMYSVNIPNGRPKDLLYSFYEAYGSIATFSSRTETGYIYYAPALLDTVPFSGNNNVLIPSLSASTCDILKCGNFNNNTWVGINTRYYYTTKLLNPSDPTAFKITTNLIQNCITTTNEIDIYIYSGGTVQYFDTNYII